MIETKDKRTRKAEKFLFDINHFDDDYEEEIEEEEPPPPTFSEDELASAKEAAFKQGYTQAMTEAQLSREKHVADLLANINNNFSTLFQSEALRSAQYEAEAVSLAYVIFRKLFPALNETHGLDETLSVIKDVLESQSAQPEILVEVHPDYTDPVTQQLETVTPNLQNNCKITVVAGTALGHGDCHLRWHNGGGSRNITGLAEEIAKKLEHMLADKPALLDNGGVHIDDNEDNHNGDNQ